MIAEGDRVGVFTVWVTFWEAFLAEKPTMSAPAVSVGAENVRWSVGCVQRSDMSLLLWPLVKCLLGPRFMLLQPLLCLRDCHLCISLKRYNKKICVFFSPLTPLIQNPPINTLFLMCDQQG